MDNKEKNMQIHIDYNNMLTPSVGEYGIEPEELSAMAEEMRSALEGVNAKRDRLRWRELYRTERENLAAINETAQWVRDNCESFVVLGIGGSALGPIAVRLGDLSEQAMAILDFKRGGLLFSYDLLGYGMMALSTFFIGLTVKADNRADKWLKYLMIIHGIFFFGCFIMPMTDAFSGMADGGTSAASVAALEFWCAYFLPIGILSFRHFSRAGQ